MEIVDPPELEMEKNIGKYVIMYMYNLEKFLVKIESFDRKEGTVIFTQVAGNEKDNGKQFKSTYDRNYCNVKVYTTVEEGLVAYSLNNFK
jgi:hypothetical protein